MAVFTKQPDPGPDLKKMITQLTHRLNDIDRRVRISEQNTTNQHMTINNFNDNLLAYKKETRDGFEEISTKLKSLTDSVASMEKKMGAISAKVEKLPSSAQFSMLLRKRGLGAEAKKSDLDVALSDLESTEVGDVKLEEEE